GWKYLDSGALYRLLALAAQHHSLELDDETSLETLAGHLDVEFTPKGTVLLEGEAVDDILRTEETGKMASIVAALPKVRTALLARQRAFSQEPGLVADGRDMGTTVFPAAEVKIFLTASAEARAERRYKQLKEKGFDVTVAHLLQDIESRDLRDTERSISPLKAADDAVEIDTTALTIDEVVKQVLECCTQFNV
ncbi:MAG: (d)CMP kinase, partial [Sulfuriflexus sp.]|nr:(d)CMP kinase [Sulfuriflexus sp.]